MILVEGGAVCDVAANSQEVHATVTLSQIALAPLIGAAGFQRTHPIAKARADLTGLRYADGVHDSLYRSGGTSMLAEPDTSLAPVRPDAVSPDGFDLAA